MNGVKGYPLASFQQIVDFWYNLLDQINWTIKHRKRDDTMHIEKYKRAVVLSMFRHYERAKNKNGEYATHNHQDIDASKTYLNYNLAPNRNQFEFLKDYISKDNVKCLNRENVNVMCDLIITVPRELKSVLDKSDKLPPLTLNKDEIKEFFEVAYNYLCMRYGKYNNVISSYVHLDEATPHMHFCFIPIIETTKKNSEEKILKVSAKEVVTRYDLKTLHKDVATVMNSYFGRDIGITTGITKTNGGNQTVEQLKLSKELTKECNYKQEILNDTNEVLEQREQELEVTEAKIKKLNAKKLNLENSIEEINEYKNFWYYAFWNLIDWIMAKFNIELPFIKSNKFHNDMLVKELNKLYPNNKMEYDYDK